MEPLFKSDKRKSLDRESESDSGSVNDVVAGGYCVGCGGCAAIRNSGYEMLLDPYGMYKPSVSDSDLALKSVSATKSVCPFLGMGSQEDEISERFRSNKSQFDQKLGWYRSLSAGYVRSGEWRSKGSSGGLTSWLLAELLKRGVVDGIIEVIASNNPASPQFSYTVTTTEHEIKKCSKTRYFPMNVADVACFVRENPGKYAFVGVPCFVKTMRRLAEIDSEIRECVVVHVAIVCGHLKSARFGESLAWQLGAIPGEATSLDFRHKIEGRSASSYGFSVTTTDGGVRVSPMSELAGHDWGLGMLRLKACDYCDDIVGETADVSFGDAWLPRYSGDSKGTNIVIVRTPIIQEIMHESALNGEIFLEDLPENQTIRSQEASFRHRRDGLAYRLYLDDKAGRWRPRKRTAAQSSHLDCVQKYIFRFRAKISNLSHLIYHTCRLNKDLSPYIRFVRKCEIQNMRIKKFHRYYKKVVRYF